MDPGNSWIHEEVFSRIRKGRVFSLGNPSFFSRSLLTSESSTNTGNGSYVCCRNVFFVWITSLIRAQFHPEELPQTLLIRIQKYRDFCNGYIHYAGNMFSIGQGKARLFRIPGMLHFVWEELQVEWMFQFPARERFFSVCRTRRIISVTKVNKIFCGFRTKPRKWAWFPTLGRSCGMLIQKLTPDGWTQGVFKDNQIWSCCNSLCLSIRGPPPFVRANKNLCSSRGTQLKKLLETCALVCLSLFSEHAFLVGVTATYRVLSAPEAPNPLQHHPHVTRVAALSTALRGCWWSLRVQGDLCAQVRKLLRSNSRHKWEPLRGAFIGSTSSVQKGDVMSHCQARTGKKGKTLHSAQWCFAGCDARPHHPCQSPGQVQSRLAANTTNLMSRFNFRQVASKEQPVPYCISRGKCKRLSIAIQLGCLLPAVDEHMHNPSQAGWRWQIGSLSTSKTRLCWRAEDESSRNLEWVGNASPAAMFRFRFPKTYSYNPDIEWRRQSICGKLQNNTRVLVEISRVSELAKEPQVFSLCGRLR